MPTYRREHCIHDTLRTLFQQTHQDWSLILVDNYGSNYQFDDPRIKVFTYTEKRGAAAARNFGIAHLSGELTIFFDDDDYMAPNYLETFVSAFKKQPSLKVATVEMDANKGKPRLRYATPCVCLRREYVESIWDNTGQLQDQKYYKQIIKNHKFSRGHQKHIDKVLVFVGHSGKGGLRDPEGQF